MILIWWLSNLTSGISSHPIVCRIWICTFMFAFSTRGGSSYQTNVSEVTRNRQEQKDRDDRCSHQAGESKGSFPSLLRMFVFQQEWYCWDVVKRGERVALPASPESSHSDRALELRAQPTCQEGSGTALFCYTLLSMDFLLLLFVSLHSRWPSQGCSWRGRFLGAYKHVFLWL